MSAKLNASKLLSVEEEKNNDFDESFGIIMWKIIKLAFPTVGSFAMLALVALLMVNLISGQSVYMTEGFSLGLLYINCFVLGINWGGTFGYQILASEARGKGKDYLIKVFHYQQILLCCILGLILAIFGILLPFIVQLLNPNEDAVEYLKQFMFIAAPGILVFSLHFPYTRLANIYQDTLVCFAAFGIGGLLQFILAHVFFDYTDLGIQSIAISYIINVLVGILIYLFYYHIYKKNEIDLGFNLSFIACKGVLKLIKFGILPMICYMSYLFSIEAMAFFGFMISDIAFTVLNIFTNIMTLLLVIGEASSCAMSALMSYNLGRKDYNVIFKIFYAAIVLSTLIILVFLILFLIIPESILRLFSEDQAFLDLAIPNFRFFCVVIFLNYVHFFLVEFIIVYGNQMFPFITILIGRFAVQIPFVILFTYLFDLPGCIFGMIIGQLTVLVMNLIYIYKYIEFKEGVFHDHNEVSLDSVEIEYNNIKVVKDDKEE